MHIAAWRQFTIAIVLRPFQPFRRQPERVRQRRKLLCSWRGLWSSPGFGLRRNDGEYAPQALAEGAGGQRYQFAPART